ncbi:winged helix-turn-helix domain-containing protein [Aeromicrobium chenweiae]|uniref:Cytoplasmic protein n=1 Tax=Aeromicrobium chenweiae TaxID=2079793 RepID=A0A2S0WNX3_9ACTN|nr:crosslink repair DNA glycosylase YcaQ family protein [Aeromicrobium chenweiae]AWB93011.1 cytoplasmic protein [Aeromicrobium chenweiae]TGN34001.1 winged helix-turn-helix domain-containing protein [Aeromicrobium chenweiae]
MTPAGAPQALTVLQARRITLAAQGFTRPRPGLTGEVTSRHLARVIERLGFFQIDSVNVLQRAQYMPSFSRLGPYDVEILHRAAGRAPRRLFEYWAHEAAMVDIDLWPAFRFRMDTAETRAWGGPRRIGRDKPEFVEWVLDEVARKGPLTAREIEHDAPRESGHWGWNWSEVKMALEYLFYKGDVTAARRNAAFERVYDLPERVIPRAQLDAPALDPAEAHRVLVGHAARALGVGTAQCLRDYFRLEPAPTKAAIEDLLSTGELLPATIAGWRRPAYLHRDAVLPRKVSARALLSPFDPLVFERTRTEQLFDFRYRIEIYVPAAKRVHGYYVLPFLLGDRLVARVDLKADRQSSTLLVQGAWAEQHAPPHTASELADELRLLARWLGLEAVAPPVKGDLAGELTAALASPLD